MDYERKENLNNKKTCVKYTVVTTVEDNFTEYVCTKLI